MNYSELLTHANERLFIIAEAGVNHNGNIETAYELVDAAVAAGCDAVKFQTWITENVYSKDKSIKPEYQINTTGNHESEFDTIKNLELSFDKFDKIKRYCESKGILFFSTPDEMDSARHLVEIGATLMKSASQDVTNTPFLRQLAALGLPIIYSTGACTLSELAEGVEVLASINQQLVILHCVSSYPAPLAQMNLSFIPVLKQMFGYPVGFSDHTTGIEAACVALALGARVFEKHLTLDKQMAGPDHQASLDPGGMKRYCDTLRALLPSLGDGIKRIMPCEQNTREAFRRYLVSARELPAGTILTEADIHLKKVVSGIAPRMMNLVVGAKLNQSVPADTVFDWSMLNIAQ